MRQVKTDCSVVGHIILNFHSGVHSREDVAHAAKAPGLGAGVTGRNVANQAARSSDFFVHLPENGHRIGFLAFKKKISCAVNGLTCCGAMTQAIPKENQRLRPRLLDAVAVAADGLSGFVDTYRPDVRRPWFTGRCLLFSSPAINWKTEVMSPSSSGKFISPWCALASPKPKRRKSI